MSGRAGARIHPTAIVADGAVLGEDVEIGPWSLVGADVTLGDGVVLASHVVVEGVTRIGAGTRIAHHACIGGTPQTTRHKGGATRVDIGTNCIIREFATINAGSDMSRGVTSIGDNCFIMTQVHVAHDCEVGQGVTLVNNVMLAGHVVIGDHAILGGGAAVHQFTAVGTRAFVGGLTGIAKNLIPYGMATGDRATLQGLNLVGLKRAGTQRSEIHALRALYRDLFDRNAGTVLDNAQRLRGQGGWPDAAVTILDFVETAGKRGLVTPPLDQGADADPFSANAE
ncbi:MAG: acyl-ACP--UDP-N-acetylglucosamine O-acyltransferase [Rhizobiaceae bacterium]|nr:acyl-ACP--UDP-N-acetylglucosamine O-acyltransferase [Rhizobiaceae bacterium]